MLFLIVIYRSRRSLAKRCVLGEPGVVPWYLQFRFGTGADTCTVYSR